MDMTVLTETVSPYFAPVKSALERLAETVAAAIPALAPYKEALWWMLPASAVILILFLLVVRAALKAPKKQPAMPAEATPSPAEPAATAKPEPQAAPKASAPKPAPATAPEPAPEGTGVMKSLKSGLSKTRNALSSGVDALFKGGRVLDDDLLEELEELLITSDVGVRTTMEIIETLSEKASEISNSAELKAALKALLLERISFDVPPEETMKKPHVMMVVGVNGVGKTTTIGKLATRFVREGKKVIIVAGDTFRAAASEQLTVWADRSGADIVRHKDNSDPAAVAFDGVQAAVSRNADIVIIDTAGRLHTKKNLMEELKKIRRSVSKTIEDGPHETLMVVDATTGQNALTQAQLFHEAVGIDGVALTKLDGTAKGGIVIGITSTLGVPLKYIGIGEQADDLRPFDAEEFADALL
ncbi:signal recognition particle-docking protein FtsY [Desulfoluna butyratoxydans]|uniref:Signal recognition particle receptor FtsY n=1 Tax=Desulfoluna butyratoxydans TaxID=231438 RepID=A0A4U8YQU6_9BACT|nr:signal recognition particle-docking protein FtsY [Desulfoluna butyratoxydans]VFQ46084.1 signal-recognition particle receptor ftsy [Desulfoluna butyratoxydans]